MNYDNTMIENVSIAGVEEAVEFAYETMQEIEGTCGEFFSGECSAEAEAAGIIRINSILTSGIDPDVDPDALSKLGAYMYQLCDEAERMQRFSEVAMGWLLKNYPAAIKSESEDIVESGNEEAQMLDVAGLIQGAGKIASITVNFANTPEVVA